jgi:hypothetical protein
MHRTNAVPVAISVFAIAVGALFAAAASVGLPMLAAAPPGAYRLLVVSAVLAAGGALFLVKSMRGDLVPDGKSHRQIRLEAARLRAGGADRATPLLRSGRKIRDFPHGAPGPGTVG